MGTVTILDNTPLKPITLIGKLAGVCYNADTSNDENNYQRGIDCIEHNHGRALENAEVFMILEGYSAKVIREWYTHIGGAPTRLQASTRYINYTDFDYIIPPSIAKIPEAQDIYEAAIASVKNAMDKLKNMYNIPREDSSMLCPLGMTTTMVDRRNVRNLIDMSRNRECSRAFWEYRELFSDVKKALSEYSAEWKTLIDMTFHPKCVELRYCPESKCCGRYPTKQALLKKEMEMIASEQKNM